MKLCGENLYIYIFFHFKVGRMRRRVILMETVESRQDVLHEFAQRSKEFVKTSVEWAPDTVQSHLQVQSRLCQLLTSQI